MQDTEVRTQDTGVRRPQSAEKFRLLADIKKKLDAARKYRKDKGFVDKDGVPGLWKRCYRYYRGRQWKSTTSGDHPKIVVNICLSMVDSVVSSLLAQSPTAYAVPLMSDPEHAQACESYTAAYAGWQEQTDAQRPLRLGLKQALIYGTNHFKVRWDRDAGPLVEVTGEDGVTRLQAAGEVVLETVSPFAIFHDPHATSLQDCDWLIQGRTMSRERVNRLMKGMKLEEVDTPQEMLQSENKLPDNTYIYEAWLEGGKRTVGLTEDRIVWDMPNPYWHNSFPYIRLVDIELPDEYEGMSTIESILSLQGEINELRSQRLIYSRYHTHPWTLVEAGAIANRKALTNEPNQIIDIKQGWGSFGVKRDWAPPMPQHLMNMPDASKRDAQETVGIGEIPQGRHPSTLVSGKAMEAVGAIASQRLEGVKARPLEQAIREVARQVVTLMAQHYRGERVASYWEGAELMQTPTPTQFPVVPFSVRVEPGTSLAVNKVARIQMALQLAMLGKISDEELFRAIEWPRWREAAAQGREQRMQELAMGMGQQGQGQSGGGNGRQGAQTMGQKMPGVGQMGIGKPMENLSNMPLSGLVGQLGNMMRRGG